MAYYRTSADVPKKYEGIDFKPPTSVAGEAEKGLEYRRRSGKGGLSSQDAGDLGIGSGVQRAVNLKNRNNLTPDTIDMMLGFFSRSEKNKSISEENRGTPWEDAGHVAWLLWGGDAGRSWAKKLKSQMEEADKKEAVKTAYLRQSILSILKDSNQSETVYVNVMGTEVGVKVERISSDSIKLKGRGESLFLQGIGGDKWEGINEHGAWTRDYKSLDEAIKGFANSIG
jgi:hypothetical protein